MALGLGIGLRDGLRLGLGLRDGHLERGVVGVRLGHRCSYRHALTAEHEAARLCVLRAQVDQVVVEHGEGGAHHLGVILR